MISAWRSVAICCLLRKFLSGVSAIISRNLSLAKFKSSVRPLFSLMYHCNETTKMFSIVSINLRFFKNNDLSVNGECGFWGRPPFPPPPILCRKNLKTRQVSSVHSNIKIQQPPGGHFGFVFEENSASKITWLPWCRTFSKISVFQIFSVHTKKQRQRFQFLLFQERFQKASFSWRIRVEGRPNRRSKAVFKFLRWGVDGILATNSITQQFRSLINECSATLSHVNLS